MAKTLSPKEFYREWAKQIPGTAPKPENLEKYYEALLKLIYNELLTCGEIRLINFGVVYTRMIKGREASLPTGGLCYIAPRLTPVITWSQRLKDCLKSEEPYITSWEKAAMKKKQEQIEEKTDEEKRVDVLNLLAKKEQTGESLVDIYDDIKKKQREERKKRKRGKTSK